MRKLTSGVAAIAVGLTIAGCTTAAPESPPASPAAVQTTPAGGGSTGGGSTGSSAADPATPAPEQAGPGGTGGPAPVDQSTPEKVMTAWLTALVGGDSENVCGLMAANGTAIEDLPSTKAQCATAVTPMLEQLASVKGAFEGLTVAGAEVQGDTATFDKATTTPLMAAAIIKNLKAVRLGDKWYVTQG